MIFGDLTSWFLVILNESRKKWDHQRSSKMFHFNIMIFYDIWWFFVTFDDYWWFWLIMIYHDWSWQITIQLGEVVLSQAQTHPMAIKSIEFQKLLVLCEYVCFQKSTVINIHWCKKSHLKCIAQRIFLHIRYKKDPLRNTYIILATWNRLEQNWFNGTL